MPKSTPLKKNSTQKKATNNPKSHPAFTVVKDGGLYRVVTLNVVDGKVEDYQYSEPDIQALAISKLTRTIADLLKRLNNPRPKKSK